MIQKIPELISAGLEYFMLTNAKTSKIEFLSHEFRMHCGINLFPEKKPHYPNLEDIVHPEDYPVMVCHLLKENSLQNEDEIIRFKGNDQSWNSYLVKSRRYDLDAVSTKPMVLSQIFPIEKKTATDNQKQINEYQQLLNSLDEAFCILDCICDSTGKIKDFLFLKTNRVFEKEIGNRKAAGKTVREIFPDTKEEWLASFRKVAITGKSIRFKDEAESLNKAWLDLHIFKVRSRDSRQIAVLFRNITHKKLGIDRLLKAKAKLERKAIKRQKALQESKELLQTVFDSTNLGIAVLKPVYNKEGEVKDFKFVRINKVFSKMFYPEVIGKTYLKISKNWVKPGFFEEFKEVFRKGEAFNQEFYFDKEGFDHWFIVTARSQNNLLIVTLEDITERKNKTRELIETTRFKKELVRTTPETILIINLNSYTVKYINKDIYPEVGMTRERIQGMPLADILPFIHPRDREIIIDLHKKLLKASDEDVLDVELRLKLKGTSWEWFNVRGKVFHRRDEKWVNEYVLLVRNITKQKDTQRALLKAEKLSIQGEVARTLAHELRNPLASIGMATEVLGKNLNRDQKEKVENYLSILTRSAETINNQINNLLNAANYSPSILKKQDLAEIVDETIQGASDRIYLEGIKVVKKYQGQFPVMADKEKLKIALLNIIVNASEATIPDKGIIEVNIFEKQPDFILSISDNGHGLEKEEISRLFDAFYTTKNTGMGVGLSSVKNILEEHDAKIKVNSIPRQGTCFHISFHNADLQ